MKKEITAQKLCFFIIPVLLFFVPNILFSQKTITGYITSFYSTDSIQPQKDIYSIEQYSNNGKLAYSCQFFFYDSTKCSKVYFYGDSIKVYVSLNKREKDSTLYFMDNKTNLTYLIKNNDTTYIQKSFYSKGKLILDSCIKSCQAYSTFTYKNNQRIETRVYQNKDTAYVISKYDKKGRIVWVTVPFNSLKQKKYNVKKIVYNDRKRTKSIILFNTGEKPYAITNYYYDTNGIPIRMEECNYENGKLSLRIVVEYR
jgi:hypothetical protein